MPGPARDGATGSTNALSKEAQASEALDLMTKALRLIDLSGGADVAGAHLDLAIHRLREWIDGAEPK
jgi:hypothetical protein